MFVLQVSLKLFQLLLSIFNHLLGGFFVIVEAGFEREGLCFLVEKVHGSKERLGEAFLVRKVKQGCKFFLFLDRQILKEVLIVLANINRPLICKLKA